MDSMRQLNCFVVTAYVAVNISILQGERKKFSIAYSEKIKKKKKKKNQCFECRIKNGVLSNMLIPWTPGLVVCFVVLFGEF